MRRFFSDTNGSMAIETAFVIPILGTLCFGGLEASQIVARNTELQSAASEATAIVLASPPENMAERKTLEEIIEKSTGLKKSKVELSVRYRCGVEEKYETTRLACLGDDAIDDDDDDDGGYSTEEISTFIRLRMEDTYKPSWVDFGIGSPVEYEIDRMVQVS